MMYCIIMYMEFEWDDNNRDKNKQKHSVEWHEAEEIFFNRPVLVLEDIMHSHTEKRFIAYGMTDTGRLLMCVYTVRQSQIRIISARDQNKKERSYYQLHNDT